MSPNKRLFVLLAAAAVGASFLSAASERITLEQILRPLERRDPASETLLASGGNALVSPDAQSKDQTEAPPAGYQHLGMSDVLPRLESWMRGYLAEEGRLTVSAVRQWRGIRLPANAAWELVWGPEVRPDSRGILYPEVSVRVDGQLYGPWTLAVQAELWRDVWVAREHLKRGATPTGKQVETAAVNVLNESGAPIPAAADLGEFETVRAIGEGHVLTWADVAPRPSVRRGEVVEVAVEQGALQIRMKAQAMEEGRKGDIVLVRNLQSRREFQALVVGPNLVEVPL